MIKPDFRVIDEDEDLLVVDKPAQLLVHPTRPGGPPTLWHGLCGLLAYELANGGQVSIINRLDRETSGLTLVAKSSSAARELGRAMMRRELHKVYLAIVRGWPEEDTFCVDAPIVREGEVMDTRIFVKQCVHPAGRECRTDVRVLQRIRHPAHHNAPFAVVEARPQTGRMHQIRVHLAYSGHPLIGDKLYTGDASEYLDFIEHGWTDDLAQRLLLDRHALHSAGLSIGHRSWHSPMPEDLQAWLLGGMALA